MKFILFSNNFIQIYTNVNFMYLEMFSSNSRLISWSVISYNKVITMTTMTMSELY